jgi:hypothetical protein
MFRYDPAPGHSICDVCGLWKAKKPTADGVDTTKKKIKKVKKKKREITVADSVPEIKIRPDKPVDNSRCPFNSGGYCTLNHRNVRSQEAKQKYCRGCQYAKA